MTGLNFAKILQPAYDLKSGALVTISAPPGSGKTFGVMTYLCQRIVEDTSFRAYFVATKKINLHPDEFRKRLVAQYELKNGPFKSQPERERYVYQTVAVLRSLEESVGTILQGQADIPPAFRSRKLTRALEQLTIYHQRHHQQPEQMMEDGRIKDYQNLLQAYTAFKQLLIQAVAAELKLDLPLSRQGQTQFCQYVARADTPAAHYLNRYFPEINLHRHQLVLLTWSKFTRSHPAFFGTSSINLASTDSLGNAMIILDEIDEMKGILVNQIIEEALKMPLDCLAFFRELYSAMNQPQKIRSKQIMTILRCNQQFSQLKKQINKLEKAYRLTMDYKTVDALAQTNFIFNVSSLTVTSSHAWWSRDDPDNKRVILTKVRPEDSKNLHFYGMVGQFHRLLKTLTRLMNAWGSSYQDEVNSRRDDLDNQLRLEDAVRTIGDALWLSQEAQRTVDELTQQTEVKQANFVPIKPVDRYGQHLQKQGLQLTSLTDSDAHLNRTQIEVVNVQTTPEKFLLKLVKRGLVVGLSATVNVETVLNNFDFNFLREQLGERLIDGMKNLSEKTLGEFDVSQRYRKKGGKVRVLEVTTQSAICEGGTCLRQLIQQRLPNLRLAKEQQNQLRELEQDVKQTMQKVHRQFQDSQNPDYYTFIQKRYLDLFDSFIYFLGHPQIPTFLGLQSILPKREEDSQSLRMNGQFIENVWQGLTRVLCPTEAFQPQLCMIAKKLSPNSSAIEAQVGAALKLPAEKTTRVYLLSAYATLGVGQNLHYPIGELERGRTLAIAPESVRSADPRLKMVDIGGVYLGQVTNVFTQIPAVANQRNRFQWIKGFYELLGLVDNGEISLAEVDRYARFQGQGIPVRQFRQTLSYVGAHTRIILQAVGRLDRAYNKLPETTVLLGTEVADYFNVTMLADYQLGPVAQAIRDYQRQKKHLILTPGQVQNMHWLEQTCETQRAVDKMVKQLQKKEEVGQQYRQYRETLIRYPTMTTQQYNSWQKKPEFAYFQRSDTAYRVQREGENFDFKQDHSGNMEVSAERADLPIINRNPQLHQLFNENQWPLSWQAADYVMNPVQFDSYLGILGEKCGRYLIEKYWSVHLQALTLPNYELFDFQTKNHVLIDFKHWRQPHRRDVRDERRHVKSKLTEIQQRDPGKNWRVLIVNLLEPVGVQQFHSQKLTDDRIMEVPFLLNRKGEFAVTMTNQREIGGFLNG